MNSQLRAWRLLALASHTVLLNPPHDLTPVTDPASAATDLTLAVLNFLLSKEEALAGEIAGYTDKINGTVAHFWPGVSIFLSSASKFVVAVYTLSETLPQLTWLANTRAMRFRCCSHCAVAGVHALSLAVLLLLLPQLPPSLRLWAPPPRLLSIPRSPRPSPTATASSAVCSSVYGRWSCCRLRPFARRPCWTSPRASVCTSAGD